MDEDLDRDAAALDMDGDLDRDAAAAAAGDASSDDEAGVKSFLIIAVSSLRYCKFPSGS